MASNKKMRKFEDLAEGINSVFPQLQITTAELLNLTTSKIIEFYKLPLAEFNVDVDAIVKKILEKHPYPATYQNFLDVYVTYACSITVFIKLYGQRFPFTEFLKSEGNRLVISRITLIMNFFYYVNNMVLQTLTPINNKIFDDNKFRKDVSIRVDEIKQASNRSARDLCNCEELMQNVERETHNFLAKCSENRCEEEKLAEENKKQKQILADKEKQKAQLLEKLAKALEGEKKLGSLIVNDYDCLLTTRDNMTKKLSEFESTSKHYSQNIQVKMHCKEKYANSIESVNIFTGNDQLFSMVNKYSTIGKINTLSDVFNDLITRRAEIQSDGKNRINEKFELDEELQGYKLKENTSKTSLIHELEELQKDHGDLINKKKQYITCVEEYDKKIELAKESCKQHEHNFKVMIEVYETQYKRILEAKAKMDAKTDKYLKDLNNLKVNFSFEKDV